MKFILFIFLLLFTFSFSQNTFAQSDSLYKKAQQKFQEKEYEIALDYLARHILRNKKDAKAYLLKGLAEFKVENPLGALKCFDSAIHHKKDYLEAYYNRASLLQGFGRYDDALRDYNIVIKNNPNIPLVRQERGKVFYSLQNSDSARIDFLQALRLQNGMWESALFLGKIYLKRKEYQKALICLDSTLKYQPNNTDAFLVKALVYEGTNNIKEALVQYDKIFDVQPYAYHSYFERGKLFFNQKNYKDALQDFIKITTKKPENPEYWLWLGKNYLAMKETKKACEAWTSAENLQQEEAKILKKTHCK